jgi:glycosyltransferase involved in cell wall biosynthesis
MIAGKFSVVTPTFNTGHFLAETIESVLDNLCSGDEYFIIDGASTDNSIDIIRSYESQISGWVSEPDSGYQEGLAKGFRRCSGEFLCWINSSDLLLSGALESASKALVDTKADLIFGDDLFIDEDSCVICRSYGGVNSLRNAMLYGGWTPLQDACFWRRSLYERVGGMNVQMKYAADYDFFCALPAQEAASMWRRSSAPSGAIGNKNPSQVCGNMRPSDKSHAGASSGTCRLALQGVCPLNSSTIS